MTTIQAQRAIGGLKAAGYKRNEFQVRTAKEYSGRNEQGKPCYTYGNAIIVVFASKERQLELAQNVVYQGIGVTIYCIDGKDHYPHYEADAKNPKIERIILSSPPKG